MGYVVLTVLVAVLAFAYQTRTDGVSFAVADSNFHLNIWDVVIVDTIDVPFAQKCRDILLENLIMWLTVYSVATLLLYVKPQREIFAPFKLNKNFPSITLMVTEFCRSGVSVIVGSVWEMLVVHLLLQGQIPVVRSAAMDLVDGSKLDLSLSFMVGAALIVYMWGDFHFYWVHRMLHIPFLYRHVHKIHHESYNPTPWSGLSFHPVEAVIYFSSAPILATVVPYYISRLLFKGLFIFPLEGHAGYGSFDVEGTCNHYIHHAKFDYNYGSSPLWDHLCGTNYTKKSAHATDARSKSAAEQARLVGCEIGDSYQAPSGSAK